MAARKRKATARAVLDALLAQGKITVDEADLLWRGRAEDFFGRTLVALVNGDIRFDPSRTGTAIDILRRALDKATCRDEFPGASTSCEHDGWPGSPGTEDPGEDAPWPPRPDTYAPWPSEASPWPVPGDGDVDTWPKIEVFANRDNGNMAVDLYVKGGPLTAVATDIAFSLACGLAHDVAPPQFVRLHLPLPDGDFYPANLTDPGKRSEHTVAYGQAIRDVLAKASAPVAPAEDVPPAVARYRTVEAAWPTGRPRHDTVTYAVDDSDPLRVVATPEYGVDLPDAWTAGSTCVYLDMLRTRTVPLADVIGRLPDGRGSTFDLDVPVGAKGIDLFERWAAKLREPTA